MDESNIKARLVFFKLNFQFSDSQNTGKCKLGQFLLRQSHKNRNNIYFLSKPHTRQTKASVHMVSEEACHRNLPIKTIS